MTPKEAMISVIERLMRDLQHLDQEFTREWELRRVMGEGGEQNGHH